MFKFIHAADIHLDSPRAGIERDPDAPANEIRQAPRRALENLVQLAIREQVAFVLIAGDLYDGNWKDFHTGLFFIEQMARLHEAGIPVFLIAGNHDAANRMTRTLKLPQNVVMFPPDEPRTQMLNDLGVAIHGQSFATAAVIEDLSKHYPTAVPGLFNIGLLHTCAEDEGDHPKYAPCTPNGLKVKGYNYWALGHIHKRQQLQCDGDPPIIFSGNLQGRHIRENGAKGCYIVTVDDRLNASLQFEAVDVFRWEKCPVDAAGLKCGDDVMAKVTQDLRAIVSASEDRPLAVRVEIIGACKAHEQLAAEPKKWHSEIEAAASQISSGQIWIERVTRRTTLPRELDETMTEGAIGELVQFIRELQQDDQNLERLAGELDTLRSQLPSDLIEGSDAVDLRSPQRMRELLDDVRQLLTHRLLAHAGAA